MMMSVFRQGRTRSQLDHLACIDLAASSADVDLITFSFLNNKPALVGLNGAQAVVKPEEPGDEAYSFETLYDTAVSQHVFARLQRHGVQSPDELKPRLYEAWLTIDIQVPPRVRIRLTAKDEPAARVKLRGLMAPGQAFNQRLLEEVANQLFDPDRTSVVTAGFLTVDDPAPDGSPEWDFVSGSVDPPAEKT
jgi:hypothetical protein